MTDPLNAAAPMSAAFPADNALADLRVNANLSRPMPWASYADRALTISATSWFVVAVIGQLLFVAYLIGFYGRAAVLGQFEMWNKVMPHGYVAGDIMGNLVISLHLAFAAVITVGGALQLITGLRRWLPTLHRWNGRVYLLSTFVMSLGGLYLVWARGSLGDSVRDLSRDIAISINAVLIMSFAGMTLRDALARRFDRHRRWALRLFLVVSGVWFFRIGLMFWIVANQGPVGFDPETFSGPTLTILAFAQYLLPLAVLELYFRAKASTVPAVHLGMASGLLALTLVTAAGIAAASMILWLPRL